MGYMLLCVEAVCRARLREFDYDVENRRVWETHWRRLKSGKLGARSYRSAYKYSPLLVCDACKRQGTNAPCKSQVRPAFCFKDPGLKKRGRSATQADYYRYLCFGCESKVRALQKRFDDADRLRIDINKLKEHLNESSKNNAGNAGSPGADHDGRA